MSLYINTDVCVEIDISTFLDECGRSELEEIVEYIKDEYPELIDSDPVSKSGNLALEYQEKFNQLCEHVYRFTDEEELFLNQLFKKYL
jgi:hypothetical protein